MSDDEPIPNPHRPNLIPGRHATDTFQQVFSGRNHGRLRSPDEKLILLLLRILKDLVRPLTAAPHRGEGMIPAERFHDVFRLFKRPADSRWSHFGPRPWPPPSRRYGSAEKL